MNGVHLDVDALAREEDDVGDVYGYEVYGYEVEAGEDGMKDGTSPRAERRGRRLRPKEEGIEVKGL